MQRFDIRNEHGNEMDGENEDEEKEEKKTGMSSPHFLLCEYHTIHLVVGHRIQMHEDDFDRIKVSTGIDHTSTILETWGIFDHRFLGVDTILRELGKTLQSMQGSIHSPCSQFRAPLLDLEFIAFVRVEIESQIRAGHPDIHPEDIGLVLPHTMVILEIHGIEDDRMIPFEGLTEDVRGFSGRTEIKGDRSEEEAFSDRLHLWLWPNRHDFHRSSSCCHEGQEEPDQHAPMDNHLELKIE